MKELPEGFTPLDSIPLPGINQPGAEETKYRIVSEVNQPIIWRFMEEKYVKKFFETGEIRLSTYAHCAELDDEVRRDTEEGKATLKSTEGELRSEMQIGAGSNAFILCTSLSQNNKLSSGKVYNACIEINDVLSFVRDVTFKLIQQIKVLGVVHGACMYNNKEICKTTENDIISEILKQTSESNSFDFSLLTRLVLETGGNKIFFSKDMDKQEECEYRMVWLTNQEQTKPITIFVPEAIPYCRPIYYKHD